MLDIICETNKIKKVMTNTAAKLIESVLIQTEKLINVEYFGRSYEVNLIITEGIDQLFIDIKNEEDEMVDPESVIGIQIYNHIVETFIEKQ